MNIQVMFTPRIRKSYHRGLQCHNDVKMHKQKCKQAILPCLAKSRFCILRRMHGSKFDNASANMAIKGIAIKS